MQDYYPPGMNHQSFDHMMRDPSEVMPSDWDSIMDAQLAFRECFRANVAILKRHGITYISKYDFEDICSGVEAVLRDSVGAELRNLTEAGFDEESIKGDYFPQFVDEQYAFLQSRSPVLTHAKREAL